MKIYIPTFVTKCDVCQCKKAEMIKPPRTLQPLPPSASVTGWVRRWCTEDVWTSLRVKVFFFFCVKKKNYSLFLLASVLALLAHGSLILPQLWYQSVGKAEDSITWITRIFHTRTMSCCSSINHKTLNHKTLLKQWTREGYLI